MADLSAVAALPAVESMKVESVRCRVLPDGRMDRENAAAYLGVKPKTLSMWALTGRGPEFVKVGGRVFYYRAVLDDFIQGRS
jgi:helix-turn-helix protein